MKSLTDHIRKVQRTVLDTVVRHHPNLGLDRRAEHFARVFEDSLPPQSRILDIGGGWGFYAAPLERRGHEVTVLDVVKPGYQKSPVMIYDGSRIPMPDNSFDVSLLITVLHHIPDPGAVLREARRVTRGKVIVIEDFYRHRIGRYWTIFRDMLYNMEFVGHPCNFKTRDEWSSFISGLGFRLEGTTEIYTWLSGLRILNGVMVFDCTKDSAGVSHASA